MCRMHWFCSAPNYYYLSVNQYLRPRYSALTMVAKENCIYYRLPQLASTQNYFKKVKNI